MWKNLFCKHEHQIINYGGWTKSTDTYRKFDVRCKECGRILHVGKEYKEDA